jgi:hypothetical protein
MMDFEIFLMLVLVSTHLVAFGTGWAMRNRARRQ